MNLSSLFELLTVLITLAVVVDCGPMSCFLCCSAECAVAAIYFVVGCIPTCVMTAGTYPTPICVPACVAPIP